MTTSTRSIITTLTAAGVLGVVSIPAIADAPFFTGLGDLPGGSFFSRAFDVSADGSVVVGSSSSALGTELFRWTASGGMQGLGGVPGASTAGRAVSADGSIIVGSTSTDPVQAFRWTATEGIVALSGNPDRQFSIAKDVSADGSVIVGDTPNGDRWTQAEGWTPLTSLDGTITSGGAFATSNDGSVIVGRSGYGPFRWTAGDGLVVLGTLSGASAGVALAISGDGSFIAGSSPPDAANLEATLWTPGGGIVGLGDLPGGNLTSEARGVSDDGAIVVGRSHTGISLPVEANGMEAFIWDAENGMRNLRLALEDDFGLDLGGLTLARAEAVSGDGSTIVGYGYNPSGETEGWIAHIPEPTTLSLLTLGGLAILRRRR